MGSPVWHYSGLCQSMPYCQQEVMSKLTEVHPSVEHWCKMSALQPTVIQQEQQQNDPVWWAKYLFPEADDPLLVEWWERKDRQTHWLAVMECCDFWQINSLYWRMITMMHRRVDDITPTEAGTWFQ